MMRVLPATMAVVASLGGCASVEPVAATPSAPVAAAKPKPEGHFPDCSTQAGVLKARCERHERMYEKCGPLRGEAHFVCDREFLLANPLKCDRLTGDDAAVCTRELAAFKTCEPEAGREFMRCVTRVAGQRPT